MKKLISNYTFNAAARTITFTDYTSVDLERLLLITNVTDNIIIYNFADPSLGAGVSGNTVTLIYNTNAMSNGDSLQIYYDDEQSPANQETLQAILDLQDFLKTIINQTRALSNQDANQRLRVNVDFFPTITTNTQSVFGEITVRQEMSRNEFANGIRKHLIF
jgi:hypothetical protein